MKNSKEYKQTRRLISIRTKVALLCAVFILIATSMNFLLISKVSKETITKNTEATTKDLADAYGQNLSNAITSISDSANFLMQSQEIADYLNSNGTSDAKEIKNYISMFLNMNTTHEDISLVNKDGIILYSSNEALINKNISKETYFINTTVNGTSSQSDVFLSDSTGEACVIFSIPIREFMEMNHDDVPEAGNMIEPDSETIKENMSKDFIGVITVTVQVSELSQILSNISLSDNASGYAYLLDSKGTVIYHPNDTLIGGSLNIDSITNLVAQISDDSFTDTGTMTYTFDEEEIYAGYHIDTNNHWILVIAAKKSEVLSSLNEVTGKSFIFSLLLMAVLSVISYFFAGSITGPIRKLTKYIQKTAKLDFTNDNTYSSLSKSRDETGEMSLAIEKMRSVISSMLIKIGEASENILSSAEDLSNISKSVNDYASDNSATAEELSAGMEETAATTDLICTNINNIGYHAREIFEKALSGMNLSTKLTTQAQSLTLSTSKAVDTTRSIYGQVKEQSSLAISKAKSVEKINALTDIIKEIAANTSLLSLNASIEAARAGESGRGFSIVAGEIGHLADRSAKTVTDITHIISEVNTAVISLTDCLGQSLDFLEKNVLSDYNDFLITSNQYNEDAKSINRELEGIHGGINYLNKDLAQINTSITEINVMINDSSKAINDMAEKNTDIVGLTGNTYSKVNGNRNHALELKRIIDNFKVK